MKTITVMLKNGSEQRPYNEEREFDTQAEAIAFCEGVEYVNDSAVEIADLQEQEGKWIVFILDQDKRD